MPENPYPPQKEINMRFSYWRTWTKIMSAPASASPMATACPIPRVPPVTRAVSPLSENKLSIVRYGGISVSVIVSALIKGLNSPRPGFLSVSL